MDHPPEESRKSYSCISIQTLNKPKDWDKAGYENLIRLNWLNGSNKNGISFCINLTHSKRFLCPQTDLVTVK